jgi:hypothetical protein
MEMVLYVGGDNDQFVFARAALGVAARERCTLWRRCMYVKHVVRAVQRGVAQSGPRHITITGATPHRFAKQADIFQELNGHQRVIE